MMFKDKIALITGASRGIGAATAIKLAENGAHVILVARSVKGLEKVDDQIQALGGTATLVPCDLTEDGKVEQLSLQIAERFKKLDILIGNAANLGVLGPLAHTTDDVWDTVIKLNLKANWRLIRSFDPLLRLADHGRVVFTTSDLVQTKSAYWGAYTVSKAALEALAQTYAKEIANTNIKVNLVDPGTVDTAMLRAAFPGGQVPGVCKPEDVTDLFVKACSDTFNLNGTVISKTC